MLVLLVQAVQQAPTASPLPEWERTLISAAVGAFFAIIGNIAMEFVKPYLMKRTIAHQLWVEFFQNYDRMEQALFLTPDMGLHTKEVTDEVQKKKWNEIKIAMSLMENDRFQFYYATEKTLLYKADPEGHLRKFYDLARRALPSAIADGKYDEARQILHMAFVTGDLYLGGKGPKREDRERYLREMDRVLAGLKSEIETSLTPERSPSA